jgi:L-methionine (R)-S-oxide reductase
MTHGEAFAVVKGRVPAVEEKHALYQDAIVAIEAILEDEMDPILVMATIVAVLHQSMPHFFWSGFYRVVSREELLVGPYQGTPACLRIAHGKGVCGTAWAEARTIVVADVHAFPGHIACDARSASEIVVPWCNDRGEVVAVLDIDSDQKEAFDTIDEEWLGKLALRFPLS